MFSRFRFVQLSPGKIDTESASPPNSHDVAVRMLFDKKKKGKKKRLGWKKTEAEHASKGEKTTLSYFIIDIWNQYS